MPRVINPYLNFPGNAGEAFEFYKSVFGGEFTVVQRFKDVPGGPPAPADAGDMMMHIALPVGGTTLMASDAPPSMGMTVTNGNNVHLSVHAESKDEADRLFNGLSKGGQVKMPMENQFWGAYFGMCADKFGVNWMISFEPEKK